MLDIEGMVERCNKDGQPRLFLVTRVCAGACSQTMCVTTDFLVVTWHMAFMRSPDKGSRSTLSAFSIKSFYYTVVISSMGEGRWKCELWVCRLRQKKDYSSYSVCALS